jgi:hypothetical protein
LSVRVLTSKLHDGLLQMGVWHGVVVVGVVVVVVVDVVVVVVVVDVVVIAFFARSAGSPYFFCTLIAHYIIHIR